MSAEEILKRGERARAFMHQQAAVLARRDPVLFCKYVLRDEQTQGPIELAPMHSTWHDLYTKNKQLIIWAHREAGKSVQLTVGRTLYELGLNPGLRVVICSARAENATKFAMGIRRYIEQSEELHRVFPMMKPSVDQWTQDSFTIERPGISRDPSVRAIALHGSGVGSRIDLLILDDILTWDNCRTPAEREKTIAWVRATLLGAMAPGGRVLVLGNAYHPQDALYTWANEGWPAFRYPVMDPHTGEVRWPKRWTTERIEAVRKLLGPLEFARQMMCVARDDSSARFKWDWIQSCLANGYGKAFDPAGGLQYVPDGFKICTGVDLNVQPKDSADLAVIFSIIVHPRSGMREVLAVESGRWGGPETWNRLTGHARRWMSHVILVENNAAQDFFLQFTADKATLPIAAFTTGRNKAHPEHGVESIAIEMANRKWSIPSLEEAGSMKAAHPELEKFVEGCMFYSPDAHTADHLMAAWFAREGISRTVPKMETGYFNTLAR